jgi:hypothetical protein
MHYCEMRNVKYCYLTFLYGQISARPTPDHWGLLLNRIRTEAAFDKIAILAPIIYESIYASQ